MPFGAVGLSGVAMPPVAHCVELVDAAGSPAEIGQPVVGGVVIPVQALHPHRAGADERFEDQAVNEDVSPSPAGMQRNYLMPTVRLRSRLKELAVAAAG